MQSAPQQPADHPNGTEAAQERTGISAWACSRVGTLAVIVAMVTLVSWFAIPRLPPGICFDDWGDIQLSSATLGIAHPPGYPGYASIGYLLTRVPGVDPAYVITVACFLTGLSVLVACVLLQRHFGASIWLSFTVCLVLAAHPRFWINLRAPEVYMPTLALMVWSAFFLLRYFEVGARKNLFIAVLLFGFALGNRPPVLLAAPFFLLAWSYAARRWTADRWGLSKELAWMAPLAIAPTVYSAAYIYVRDQPNICYNYIDVHNEEVLTLPDSTEGVSAKLRRVHWQMTAQQFRRFMGTDWRGFVSKLRWLRTQIVYEHPFTDLLVLVLLTVGIDPPAGDWYGHMDMYFASLLSLFGLFIAFRRSRACGWLLTGMMVQCLVFVLAYQVFGQSADLLPLLFAQAVALGVLGSKLFPAGAHWVRQLGAFTLAVGGGLLFALNIPTSTLAVDASNYARKLDFATFPGPSVICGNWTKTIPMRYAQCILTPRNDLHIVTSGPELWMNLAETIEDQPVYAADVPDSDGRCTATAFRNIYRLDCSKGQTGLSPAP